MKKKKCQFCGKIMFVRIPSQKFHKKCFKLHRKEYNRVYGSTLKRKTYIQEYAVRPETKLKQRIYGRLEKVRVRKKKYSQESRVKKKRREQARERRKVPFLHDKELKVKRKCQKKNRAKNIEYLKQYHKTDRARLLKKKRESLEPNVLKIKTRKIASRKIKIPLNQICQKCNKEPAVEKHHEDYYKPLEVMFLCKKCHSKLRRKNVFLEG